MADIIKFTVSGKPEYIKVVRMGIGALACGAGFDVEAVDDIKLAVDEACKAVTCHGHRTWTDMYEVTCELFDAKLVVTLRDAGEGDRSLEKEYRPCRNCPQDGNMAMILIKTLMDETEIKTADDGQKSIVMVKNK